MKIAVVGTGCVGLVNGAIFSIHGYDVLCVDNDKQKIENLRNGILPNYEPGLHEIVQMGVSQGTLYFTTDTASAVSDADIIFLCVGTPQSETGAADLSNLFEVAEEIAGHLKENSIVIIKSTVPIGTNAKIATTIQDYCYHEVVVASNPEFLREGTAVDDCLNPDRIVLGVRNQRTAEVLSNLYEPLLASAGRPCPIILMSPESAEMTKYTANSLLAMKVSFINEIANLCEHLGADIERVRQGICTDRRIGWEFLRPSPGYGGSCFSNDLRSLTHQADAVNCDARLLKAVDEVNEMQKNAIPQKILEHFSFDLVGKRIGIWGLAFKPKTDDTGDSPSIRLIESLLRAGAEVRVHDPEAIRNAKKVFGDEISYHEDKYEVIQDSDALVVMTSWPEYLAVDPIALQRRMRDLVVFDGQNCLNRERFIWNRFDYYSIGRPNSVSDQKDLSYLLKAATLR